MQLVPLLLALVTMLALPASINAADPLEPENLVAWCIVPFDASKRTPEARAEMLDELGVKRCAYDWRAEHVPTFEREIQAYQEHGIEFFAFWSVHDEAFRLFEKYDLHPQIWLTVPAPESTDATKQVTEVAAKLAPLARRTQEHGCKLGLYNHGGWGGEPENMVAVCEALRKEGFDNVGIVYNFHHGHGHIEDFAAALKKMQPYLLCLNLNGMNDGAQPKIVGIGKGQHERAMIRTVLESGYDGPIGVLDHRGELDAKESLKENLDGLAEVRKELAAKK